MARDINKAGLGIVQEFEGLRLTAYDDLDPKRKLKKGDTIKGTLTIGYGHTGPDVFIGQVIDAKEAERLLRDDIDEAEGDVERVVTVPVNDNEFSALVSFAFNCSDRSLRQLVRRLNAGDRAGTADAFRLFNKSGKTRKVLDGLTRRRAQEAALFLKPVGAAARSTSTQTPDGVAPRMSSGQKAKAAAIAGGSAVYGGEKAGLWDGIAGALKDTSEWTWGLPETLGSIVLAGAVLAALWFWWRRRQARTAKAGAA